MDFQLYLQESASEVERELESLYDLWRKDAKKVSPVLLPLIDITIEACKGGKRVRGALVKLGFELANDSGQSQKDIIKVGAAFEIFQTAILAHDDIIDKSPLRRGKPTIYKALGGDHYAISQTICLGDVGFFHAMEIISKTNFPEKNKNLALQSFSRTMLETALGEILDVEIPHLKTQRQEKDVITISHLKTARYTITGPLLLGAILAGSEKKLLTALKEFGDNLGVAFQIQDDILGVFGTEGEIGKSVTSDIEEGKNTLLITESLKKATPKQKATLEELYGRESLTPEQINQVKEIFEATGALDYSRALALEYVGEAKKLIPEVSNNQAHQNLLNQMADYLIERKK
jgi:geranylgeranyl diphosphate synthase type I